MQKYHIEKNTVQETLVIPLFGRMICSRRFPNLFLDPDAEMICSQLDYDFSSRQKKMESLFGLFGAMEVAQRQYDLAFEVKEYLKSHPRAAVVNLGCGLDNTFQRCDNGSARGFNIDLPDVITIRNEILPAREREVNLGCDLSDFSWMDQIDGKEGAVFFASGVFYYFRIDAVKELLVKMAERFPGGMIAFDTCNAKGASMMTKTWLKEAGIHDIQAYFSLEDERELTSWSENFASVTAKSYMCGYRDIRSEVSPFYRLMIWFCDHVVNMKIVQIRFRS